MFLRDFSENIEFPIKNGKFQFGTYNKPFVTVNLLETDTGTGKFFKNLRLKEWQAFQIGNDRFFILIALYNAKILGVVQFLIYDKFQKKHYFYKKNVFPSKLSIPNSLKNSTASYFSKNLNISVTYFENGDFKISANSKKFKNLPEFTAEFTANYNENIPQIVCIPFDVTKGMYSQKSALTAEGKLTINEEVIDFKKNNSFLVLDDHKGFYPNPMIYDWCTASKVENGNVIAFNLTDNQSIEPDKFNENCLWINNKIYFLPPVKFFRTQGVYNEWIIKDKYSIVNLKFKPEVENTLNVKLGFMKINYYGPFGTFEGYIKPEGCNEIIIDNFFGMGEQKFVKG